LASARGDYAAATKARPIHFALKVSTAPTSPPSYCNTARTAAEAATRE
jgi:hypothetical protein